MLPPTATPPIVNRAPDPGAGTWLLCLVCLLPTPLGGSLGWWLKYRHQLFGFPGMLLPRKLREKLL